MTEHVCEWILDTYRDPDEPERLSIGMFCFHKGCTEQRNRAEAEARINATERLSAEDARRGANRIDLSGHSDLDVMVRLRSYADILEGKE